nr:ABC transporter permease [uncultured Dysosmobacter sp.]
MNLIQAFKMAWKSIWGKKGRSALTILGIFIGIAAVMTIVSVLEGMKEFTRQQYAAMGSNRISVNIWSNSYDEEGNSLAPDYFPDLYDYCNGLREYVDGVTPNGRANATVVYGTKSSANMEYSWDDEGNIVGDMPPELNYVSDQYSACSNLTVARGRDLAYLDMKNYNQVCVMGAQAAKTFFGSANPVGKELQVNGNPFLVVGVYASRLSEESAASSNIDNFIAFPYTTRRVLGGEAPSQFTVKVKEGVELDAVIPQIGGFLKGLVGGSGSYDVSSENQWQDYQNESLTQMGIILGGIAAISLLVGGIGIMNIMLVTVTERTREIGIRRAIGAQRANIVAQFLIEAAMLCGLGGLVGIAVGTLGSVILSTVLVQITVFPPLWVTAAAFALSLALGILFGGYPAMKASRLQPVEALRAE